MAAFVMANKIGMDSYVAYTALFQCENGWDIVQLVFIGSRRAEGRGLTLVQNRFRAFVTVFFAGSDAIANLKGCLYCGNALAGCAVLWLLGL